MKTLLLLLFLAGSFGAGAQDSLLVYQLKGKAQLINGSNRQQLKIGSKFSGSKGRLEIEKGGAVTLISSTYESKEFTRSSAMTDVSKSFSGVKRTDVTGKYFSYVWDQFTHKHGSPEADRRKYMSNAGGVARGCPGIDASNIPDTIFYTGRSLRLRWTSSLPSGRVFFKLQPKGASRLDSVFRVNVDTAVTLPDLQQQLKPGAVWKWSLQVDKQEPCFEGVIVYVTPERFRLFENELKKELPSDPASAAMMMGFMLELSRYLDAAEAYYREALRLSETNP